MSLSDKEIEMALKFQDSLPKNPDEVAPFIQIVREFMTWAEETADAIPETFGISIERLTSLQSIACTCGEIDVENTAMVPDSNPEARRLAAYINWNVLLGFWLALKRAELAQQEVAKSVEAGYQRLHSQG